MNWPHKVLWHVIGYRYHVAKQMCVNATEGLAITIAVGVIKFLLRYPHSHNRGVKASPVKRYSKLLMLLETQESHPNRPSPSKCIWAAMHATICYTSS
jgi:hypothetical protein